MRPSTSFAGSLTEQGSCLILTGRWPAPGESFIRRDLLALRQQGFPFLLAAVHGDPAAEVDGMSAMVLAPDDGNARSSVAPDWLRRAGRRWRHRANLARLRDMVRAFQIRHLHAAHLDLPGFLVSEIGRELGISFSLEGHARDIYCSAFDLKRMCSGAAFVTVCNNAARQALGRQAGIEALLQHHCLPLPTDVSCRLQPHSGRLVRMGVVGRLTAKKGVPDAMRIATAAAARLGGTLELVIVGDGEEATRLRDMARTLPAEVQCLFTGWLSTEAVRELMAKDLDLLMVPAQVAADGDRDGIPNVILEAMACDLPVAAAAVGGIPEVVGPETGWLFAADDLESAAQAVESIIRSPLEAARRAIGARQLLATEFNPETVATARIDRFTNCLGVSCQPPGRADFDRA